LKVNLYSFFYINDNGKIMKQSNRVNFKVYHLDMKSI